MKHIIFFSFALSVLCLGIVSSEQRPRLREFGIKTGILDPGPLNAITDVPGVKVGQVTLIVGDNIRTGVTAIIPHDGNIFQEKVPGAIYVANGYGKLMGITQVEELGNIETPIILTNTLSVPTAADAVIDYILSLPGNETVESVNPVVGETNDGGLNDIRGRHVKKEHVIEAIKIAKSGPVEEGCVGAGTGTTCYGWKGGIGTASRKLPESRGGYTVGVLVQTNHGGVFQINGYPVGIKLGNYYMRRDVEEQPEGSCMVVVATDAPLENHNLKRLAVRAILGIPRTGGFYSTGSGDYCIAFSTAKGLRIPHRTESGTQKIEVLRHDRLSALFLAAAEACEEAILNSLFKATTMEGREGHKVEALPLDKVKKIMEEAPKR
ncbi:MAG: P1 family peptidase [Candidatus Aminicenantes bacterium]|nr:P1 family peptidase [Candidatus Aminicenantes bacterium]MDH5744489.1 P1 family peptidase [Candidatus Aminicenantes bacterium]